MGGVGYNASVASEAVNTDLVIDATNDLRHIAVKEIGDCEDDGWDKGDDNETPNTSGPEDDPGWRGRNFSRSNTVLSFPAVIYFPIVLRGGVTERS